MSAADQQLTRWGGLAGLGGAILLVMSAAAVAAFGLPDASEVETLTDFEDIKTGRIFEHLFYLGSLVLFGLHVIVLQRLLRGVHLPAALFGAVVAEFGLIIMAASSMLHVSTSPLSELYTDPDASPEDLRAIEYAWHGAQSVFDTMLTTGVLLVPIGIVLFATAMRKTSLFSARLTMLALGLGIVGIVGALIAIVDPGSMFSALSVLAIVVFHAAIGWRMLKLGSEDAAPITATYPATN